jgi:hypothetical protein
LQHILLSLLLLSLKRLIVRSLLLSRSRGRITDLPVPRAKVGKGLSALLSGLLLLLDQVSNLTVPLRVGSRLRDLFRR